MSTTAAVQKSKGGFAAGTPSPKVVAILSLLAAQFAISIGVFFIKVSVLEIGSLSTIFNRFWIAGLVFFVWNQGGSFISSFVGENHEGSSQSASQRSPKDSTDNGVNATVRTTALLLVTGFVWAACLVLWAFSLEYTNIANSTLMHDLSPLFATILGWLIFKHRFSQQFLIAVGITLAGVATIEIDELQLGLNHLLGDGLGLLSAMLLALYCLLVEKLRSQLSFTLILQWVCWFGSLGLVPIIFMTSGTFHPVSSLGWLAITGVVVFAQIIGQGLTAFSLKTVSSEMASLFFPLEAVFVALVAWLHFGEQLSGLNCLGFGLVLIGIYVALLSPPQVPAS